MSALLRFERHARGRPYHAARVRLGPRARQSELHEHADFYELFGVTSGAGEQLFAGHSQAIAEGDVVFVRPGDHHAFCGSPPDGVEFINVAFPAEAWRHFIGLVGLDPDHGWDDHAAPPTFRLGSVDRLRALGAFETALARFHAEPTPLDLVRFWADLLVVLVPLRASGVAGIGARGRPDWFVDACTAMRQEANLRRGVARLRELANVSAAHLSRSMREFHAMTPTQFVTDLRLDRAASLLATTNEAVTQIAYRCGFSSQSYFTRCFRSAYELTPREFRRRAQRAFVP